MRSTLNRASRIPQLAAAMLPLVAFAASARADIFQWEYINPADPSQGKEQSTTLAPDGAGVDALPGADLSGRNLTMAYLIGADLTNATAYQTNLTNADLSQANLINADLYNATLTDADFNQANLTNATFLAARLTNAELSQANLTYAYFGGADLTGADFTDAEVRGASFARTSRCAVLGLCYGSGITLAQLYSTASYLAYDLSGVGLGGSDLSGGNFAGHNLTNTSFTLFGDSASLTAADLTAADARGAYGLDLSAATTTYLIWPDGHISGLDLEVGGLLVVRDYDGARYDPTLLIPISVDQHLTMGPGGTLRMVFEADAWDSTISFAPGIRVTLGGTLELNFAADVNLASQVGRTFDLFNWTGVTPTGVFTVSSPYVWNLSNLYTTGQVTLTAVPEPATVWSLFLGMLTLADRRRRRKTASVAAPSTMPPMYGRFRRPR